MKKINFSFTILFVLSILINDFTYSQCPPYPSDWSKRLTKNSYTWAFYDDIIGMVMINGTIAQESDIPLIKDVIRGAVNGWKVILQSANITFIEIPSSNYNSADIKINFSLGERNICGYANPDDNLITLGITGWKGDPLQFVPWYTTGNPMGVDLQTVVTHELGHLILGGQEWNAAIPYTIMRDDLCQADAGNKIIRKPLSCDEQAVRFFYTREIEINQIRHDNTRLSGTPVGRWRGSYFENLTIPNYPFILKIISPINSREILRGYQQLVYNPAEKYYVWEKNNVEQLDTIQNHRGFTVDPFIFSLNSCFNLTYPTITIKTDLLELPGTTGGNIEFRDPWYIDYRDPQYGYNWRNRGMQEARFLTRSLTGQFANGWQPDFTTIYPESPYPYNGVFLNENPRFEPGKPYYSVRVPQSQIIYSKAMCFGFLSTRLFKNISREGAKLAELHGVSFTEFNYKKTSKK